MLNRYRTIYLFIFINIYIYIIYLCTYKSGKFSICIFGLALDIPFSSVIIFIKSLNATEFKGTIILFLYNTSRNFIRKYNFVLKIIIIDKVWPFYSNENKEYHLDYNYLSSCIISFNKYKYKWNIYRFSFIDCWLKKYVYHFDFYFILDVRDTIFQRNIEDYKYMNNVYLSEDARKPFRIKDDAANRRWINVYTNDSSIENNVPINSGTIYGSNIYFTKLINIFVYFIKTKYINVAEQGTLNFLYYTGKFKNIPIVINTNDNGIIYNMGIEVKYKNFYVYDTYSITNKTVKRLPSLSVPFIVHQYDRDKQYLDVLKNVYTFY